jgi:hypothetical protein
LGDDPVDGTSGIAFASGHKRLWRLAFSYLSTTCNYFAAKTAFRCVKALKTQKDP